MTAIEISVTLQELVDAFADAYYKSGEIATRILEQAELEGLSKEQTRELVISALKKRRLSDRQVYRALPEQLKDATKSANRKGKTSTTDIESTKSFVDIMSSNEPKQRIRMSPAMWRGKLFMAMNQGFDVMLIVEGSTVVDVRRVNEK